MAALEFKDPLLQQLVDEGTVTAEQATEALDEHERTGEPVREIIRDMGLSDEDNLLRITAEQLGVEVVDVSDVDIPQEVIRSVPAGMAQLYNVVPLRMDAHSIVLVTYDLLSPEVVDELNFVLTRDIELRVAKEADVKALVAHFYGDESDSVTDMLASLESELEDVQAVSSEGADADNIDEIAHAANLTPVVRFVNVVLYQAVKDRASDIHFEPFENEFKIRYRVDGALYEMSPPPKHLALPVISRVKVIAELNIAERRLPQDGRIQLRIAGRTIDFRVSTLPTQHGESVVLRVLDRSVVELDIDNLGMPEDVRTRYEEDIHRPNGIIIVTGPTGSGKTTTLYSSLKALNSIETKLLTAEEPVEYDIDGIVQLSVNERIGMTFSNALRAFLRQDPDIIMVGEIRDVDTAQIAIQASLTGHLVFSTLHTNDSAGAVTRLVDMGLEPFLISSTLEGILAQRLVRTVCSECRTAYKPEADILEQMKLKPEDIGDREFFFGKGCNHCSNTGYRGRRGIYEYMRISDPLRDLINERKPTLVLRQKAVELGMRVLREDGVRCILDGATTVEEVLKYT